MYLFSGSGPECKSTLDDWVQEKVLGNVELNQKQVRLQDQTGNIMLGDEDLRTTIGTDRHKTYIIV